MRTGVFKPFLAALAGSALLVVAMFALNFMRPEPTVVEAAPAVAAPSLAATDLTTVTMIVYPAMPMYGEGVNIYLDRHMMYTNTEMSVKVDSSMMHSTWHTTTNWTNGNTRTVVMPGKQYPGTYMVTATIMVTGTEAGKVYGQYAVQPMIKFDSSVPDTITYGNELSAVVKIMPEVNYMSSTNEIVEYDFDEDGPMASVVITGSTSYKKADKPDATYVYTSYTFTKAGTHTLKATYKSGIYGTPYAMVTKTIVVEQNCPSKVDLMITGGQTEESAAIEGTGTGKATLDVSLLNADGSAWIPGNSASDAMRTVFVDSNFAKSAIDDKGRVAKDTGKGTGSVESAIAGVSSVKASYSCNDMELTSNPVTVTFTRDETQGVYEVPYTVGQATSKQMPASTLAALTDGDKAIGTAEIPANMYDVDVVVRFAALEAATMDQTTVPSDTNDTTKKQTVIGWFLVDFFYADGKTLNPILEEGVDLTAPIQLTYSADSTAGKEPYTAYWNKDAEEWTTSAGVDAVSVTTQTVVTNLKRYGEFAKFFATSETGEVIDPASEKTVTFGTDKEKFEVTFPAGAYGEGIRMQWASLGKTLPTGVGAIAFTNVKEVLEYFQLTFTKLDGTPIKDITFLKPVTVKITVITTAPTARLQGTVSVSDTQILKAANYCGDSWSLVSPTGVTTSATDSTATMTLQASQLCDTMASLTANEVAYLPFIQRAASQR